MKFVHFLISQAKTIKSHGQDMSIHIQTGG